MRDLGTSGSPISARLVVNLNDISTREHGCYLVYGVFVYLLFAPGVFRYIGFTEAQEDHLAVFSPGPFQKYRTEGLPILPQCRVH